MLEALLGHETQIRIPITCVNTKQNKTKLKQFKTADVNVPAYLKHFKSRLFSWVAWNK